MNDDSPMQLLGRKVTADTGGGRLAGTVTAAWQEHDPVSPVDVETVCRLRTAQGQDVEVPARCCRLTV